MARATGCRVGCLTTRSERRVLGTIGAKREADLRWQPTLSLGARRKPFEKLEPFVTIGRQHILGNEVLSCALELKLIDIFRGNDHRGAKNNLAIFTNRIVAKPARCKCLALLASYFALGISLRGIIS
jgi:hypothetical protein